MKKLKIKNKKIVYLAISNDIFSGPYLDIIKKAKKHGYLIVGLLTDKAISKYKTIPNLNYEERLEKLKTIKFIDQIVKQDTLDYTYNLKLFKPNIVVHGDDWRAGIQKKTRENVIKTLNLWKAKLIEYPYDKKFSLKKLESLRDYKTSNHYRQRKLSRILKTKKLVRILEAHNPISALIAEKSSIVKNKTFNEFDAIWSSSLTDSTSRGKPDNQSVDFSTRLSGLNEIMDITTKPIVFDADNGGKIEHLKFTIKTLDRMGVSGVVLEDKVGLKVNSLSDEQFPNSQDNLKGFSKKIKVCCENRFSDDFLVIARVESLVLGKSVQDLFNRSVEYSKAGADLIFVSCKDNNPIKLFQFSKKFKKSKYYKPIVAVPSTYSHVKEKKLIDNHINVVIYANHLLRSAYPAMKKTAISLLRHGRAHEIEKKLMSIKEILNLVSSDQ